MINALPFSSRNIFRRTGVIGLVCVLAATASACGGAATILAAATKTPTATTLMGGISSPEPATITPGLEGTSTDSTFNACGLATQSEAEAVIGQTVISVKPGEDPDNTFGKTLHFCTYLGKEMAVVISYVDMDTPAAAVDALNSQLADMESTSDATTTEESGIGDQTYWTTTENGCSFTVRKGSKVLSIGLGGNIGDPSSHKAALRTLTESVVARI
jgi:hypothetical protein